jgi:hypothetical protein
MKALFPVKICQIALIAGEMENRRELGKKKGLHDVYRRLIVVVSVCDLLKTPVPDKTWQKAQEKEWHAYRRPVITTSSSSHCPGRSLGTLAYCRT